MDEELPLPEPEHSLGALLELLISVEFDEFLSCSEWRKLSQTAPGIHIQLFVHPPWKPLFAALEVE